MKSKNNFYCSSTLISACLFEWNIIWTKYLLVIHGFVLNYFISILLYILHVFVLHLQGEVNIILHTRFYKKKKKKSEKEKENTWKYLMHRGIWICQFNSQTTSNKTNSLVKGQLKIFDQLKGIYTQIDKLIEVTHDLVHNRLKV